MKSSILLRIPISLYTIYCQMCKLIWLETFTVASYPHSKSHRKIAIYLWKYSQTIFIVFLMGYCLCAKNSYATIITVPSKIKFANMQLYINPIAKEAIQEKVNSLTCSNKHYKEILDRVNLYMPLIEKILQEEGVFEDFKYLVIQESILIGDHVSESNAVGFWQFKKEAASEVGIRMDRYSDERMHIISSTRGFAKYIKKNQAQFNNWLYALLAYYLGRSGAKKYIEKKNWHIHNTKAVVDDRAHWYIYHFLAHKLAFQNTVGKELHPALCLYECHDCQGKTLHELSQQFEVSLDMIKHYNKWLKALKVPEDMTCSILIPLTHQQYAKLGKSKKLHNSQLKKSKVDYHTYWQYADKYPDIAPLKDMNNVLLINGIPGVIAQLGDTAASLAQQGNIPLQQFLQYNDITQNKTVQPGQVYYWKAKHSKASVHYHIVRSQETWWSIAQKYGMKQAVLLRKNRLNQISPLKPGQVLWLRFIRPANLPVVYLEEALLR